MVSIILAASNEVEKQALSKGFKKIEVLIRHEAVMSTEEEKARIEGELMRLRPFQFLVSDYWGAGPE